MTSRLPKPPYSRLEADTYRVLPTAYTTMPKR